MYKLKVSNVCRTKGVKRKCVWCGATERLTIDHIIPKSEGGSNIMSNYQIMCNTCNEAKGCKPTHVPEDYISYSDMIADIHSRYSKGLARHIVKISIVGCLGDVMTVNNYNRLVEYLSVYGINLKTDRTVRCPVGADNSFPKINFNFNSALLLNRYFV